MSVGIWFVVHLKNVKLLDGVKDAKLSLSSFCNIITIIIIIIYSTKFVLVFEAGAASQSLGCSLRWAACLATTSKEDCSKVKDFLYTA